MKMIVLIFIGLFAVSCDSNKNLPDPVDANLTPSGLEQREEEDINLSDPVDENLTPAQQEEREIEERSIYSEEEGY